MAKPFNTLTIDDIILLNKYVIDGFGGLYTKENHNLHNLASLDHVLEATVFTIFGEDLYQDVYTKIAAIVQVIITAHVFNDGNKRTGLAVLCSLAHMNGFIFEPTKNDEDYIVKIASDNLSIDKVSEWLKHRLKIKISF